LEQLIIQEELSGKRLDQLVSLLFPSLTRAHAQKLIKEGAVLVNEKPRKPAYAVTTGELITVELPEPEELEVLPEDIPLDILYEDSDVILVNKPKGMVVHPAAGHASGTLVNALLYHCKDSLSGINGILRPGIVHRIDKDTTGVIIACKNDRAHQCIAAQLKEHSITRQYLALAQGVIREDEGTVDAPLVDQCPVSIECQVLDMVECGALTNVIARVTRRVVDEDLIDENDAFRSDRFSPISYMGDGDGRLYRYFSDESVKMGSIIKEIRKQEEK